MGVAVSNFSERRAPAGEAPDVFGRSLVLSSLVLVGVAGYWYANAGRWDRATALAAIPVAVSALIPAVMVVLRLRGRGPRARTATVMLSALSVMWIAPAVMWIGTTTGAFF